MASDAGHQEGEERVGSPLSRREFVVAGALGSAAAVAMLLSPERGVAARRMSAPLDQLVPARIGGWTSAATQDVLIPTGERLKERTYDDLLTRYYVSETLGPILLLIAYGSAQSGDTQLHRPEVCYPAAGFELRDWPDALLNLPGGEILARNLTASATGRIEQILYWSRIGNAFPTDSLQQRWTILRQTLRSGIPDGALVRISTIDEDRGRSMQRLRDFAAALVGSGGPQLRTVLTGERQ